MIRFKSFSWVAAGLVALMGIAQAAPPAAGADEAAIREQTTSWIKAFNGDDAKAIAALYAADSILMPPGAKSVKGPAAIESFIAKEIAAAKKDGAVFSVTGKTDVGVSGDMGWESGAYAITAKGAVVEAGKFLSVSRKKDGKWLYMRDTWNADAPPAPAAPATAAKAPPASSAPATPPPVKK